MKHSLFSKIFGGYVVMLCVAALLFAFLSFGAIKKFDVATVTEGLRGIATCLATYSKPFLEGNKGEELDARIKELGTSTNTRITVINAQGIVLADSQRDPVTMENHSNRPEVMQALRGEASESERYSTTIKEDMVYVAVPIKSGNTVVAVLRVGTFLRHLDVLLGQLKGSIVKVILFIVAIALLGALGFSRLITKPIKELRTAFQQVASADFEARVFLKGRSEARELADGFNAMAERLKALFAELSREKESVQSIIASVQVGLAVLDSKDKIILSNDSFKKVANQTAVEGRFFWECIRDLRCGDLIKKVRSEKRSYTEEVTLNNRVYLSNMTFLERQNEVVVILHDITAVKEVEKIKKDFVVNVSHELRTPLTAIKGFAETLEETVDDESRQYVEIIKRNTDRLINIVRDLLLLSELEEKGSKLTVEEIDLNEILQHVMKIFAEPVKAKGINFILEVGSDIPRIHGDIFKLEQVFVNLLDNAIKYTEEGSITLSLDCQDGKVRIEIADTGIGIPKEHLPRIFERFYVADKSRSRMVGGTGLGLSIVKHIVSLHKGTIAVESTIGLGTKFIVSLPTNPS